MRRSYQPSAFIIGTLALHLAILGLLLFDPSMWVEALLLFGVTHLCLILAGLIPTSRILGPNLLRMANTASSVVHLTFDDGPDPVVTPKVLEILESQGMKATFFLIGERVNQHPVIARQIVDQGHAVANHSLHHEFGFAFKGPNQLRADLWETQTLIHEATGIWSRYFRAPFGIRSPLLEPVLCQLGLDLVSWTHRGYDTRCGDERRVLRRLTSDLRPGSILLLHDGRTRGARLPGSSVLVVLPKLLLDLKRKGFVSVVLPGAHGLPQPNDTAGQMKR